MSPSRSTLLLSLLLAACKPPSGPDPHAMMPPPPMVTVASPTEQEVVEWDEFTGRTEAVESVEVRARVSGTLESVHFEDGGLVKKGDLLFVIDPRPYQAALDRAEAELARVQSALELAKSDLTRADSLVASKNIAAGEYDKWKQTKVSAESSLKSAQAAIDLAKLDMEYTRVTAPISGRISRRLVDPGNLVNGGPGANTLLTNIVTVDPIHLYMDADENSILKYTRFRIEGSRTSARDAKIVCEMALADEEGFPHKGVIDFVDNRLDPSTGTMRARGLFPNPDQKITPGLFARARIPGTGKYKALMISDLALSTDQGQKIVLVVDDKGTAQPRPVEVGPVMDGMRVIRNGLTTADKVIINGLAKVRPGMPVTPQEAAAAK